MKRLIKGKNPPIVMDDFEKEFPDFDWKETPANKHPKKCRCPKHEYMEERLRSGGLPLIIRLCPPHYKVFCETEDEMTSKLSKFQKLLYKLTIKLKLVVIKELKYMESEICFWCKFGSGGRGIKVAPTVT